jgi:hypothetical protein
MVTILKIENRENKENLFNIFAEFNEIHNLFLSDYILVKGSECEKFEYVYVFLNEEQLNSMINLMLEYGETIFSKTDFTNEFVEIVVNNKLEEFVNSFEFFSETVIENAYSHNITTDNVLDKISFNGFESLNELDKVVLREVA